MRLVADTNVLITSFWPNSVFRRILSDRKLMLAAPDYALEEIRRHADEIARKAGISKDELNEGVKELAGMVLFVPLAEYAAQITQIAATLPAAAGEKEELLQDVDFLALASLLQCPLWSNDGLLKKRGSVPVLTTKEVIELVAGME